MYIRATFLNCLCLLPRRLVCSLAGQSLVWKIVCMQARRNGKIYSRYFCDYSRSTCTMWTNFLEHHLVRPFKARKRRKNSPSCAYVLLKTFNLVVVVILQWTLKKCTDSKRTCKAFVLLIKPFVFWRPRCCRGRVFVRSLLILWVNLCPHLCIFRTPLDDQLEHDLLVLRSDSSFVVASLEI